MEKDLIKKTAVSFAVIVAVAVSGSIFVNLGTDWFDALNKPTQWVPNVVIPIVWTVIYSMFAIINFIGFKNDVIRKPTVVWMLINAVLNVLWCLTFFTLKQLLVGNIVIVLNTIAGFVLVAELYKNNTIFGYVSSIYPIWLTIAATLNTALWILN